MIQRILVTGGSGFVGKALVAHALSKGIKVRVSSRQKLASADTRLEYAYTGEIGIATDWLSALQGVDTVVHCAARAHVTNNVLSRSLDEFRSVNVTGSVKLAEQSIQACIRRFIFVSSIGVNGKRTFCRPFRESDAPKPQEPYALSKLEAENALRKLFTKSSVEFVIVRPPLVYGADPPGNFSRLVNLVASDLPLPLGSIANKRSFVALENLVDFLITCIDHPSAANETFLVSDGEDLSTTQLVQRMRAALGKPARLIPVPTWMLEAGAFLLGKRDLSQKLLSDLQVDISKARAVLGWCPPVSVNEGLKTMMEYHSTASLTSRSGLQTGEDCRVVVGE